MTRAALILPALLGAEDAARYLGVSKSTLAQTGIPRRALGGRRLYDRRDLDAFVDSLSYEGQEDRDDPKNDWNDVA